MRVVFLLLLIFQANVSLASSIQFDRVSIGQTRNQVRELLGKPNLSPSDEMDIYIDYEALQRSDDPGQETSCGIQIIYLNNKVVSTYQVRGNTNSKIPATGDVAVFYRVDKEMSSGATAIRVPSGEKWYFPLNADSFSLKIEHFSTLAPTDTKTIFVFKVAPGKLKELPTYDDRAMYLGIFQSRDLGVGRLSNNGDFIEFAVSKDKN